MNNIWALVTPSKKLVITDSSYSRLKIIQMLVARSIMFDVILWTNNVVIGDSESELHNKIKFIKDVIEVEDQNIANLSLERNNNALKETLNSVKEFYSLIYPDDHIIQDLIDLELTEIDAWKKAPIKHKSFIIRALHKINYLLDLDTIKNTFRKSIKNPPHDDYYVYEHLNLSMTNFLDSQK